MVNLVTCTRISSTSNSSYMCYCLQSNVHVYYKKTSPIQELMVESSQVTVVPTSQVT